MIQRRFGLSLLAATTVLLISIGVDIKTIIAAKPAATAKTAFPLPGPRRYPPAYHAVLYNVP